MTLNANALTTVAKCKEHLDIQTGNVSQDSRIESFINAASQVIESYCDRQFKSQSHTEYFHGRKMNFIMPREFPITAISEFRIDGDRVFTDANTLLAANEYTIADRARTIFTTRIIPNGFMNVKLVYTGGYATIPSDLELACIWLVEWYYKSRERKDMGRTSIGKGDERVTVITEMPGMVKELLQNYVRVEVPDAYSPVMNQ